MSERLPEGAGSSLVQDRISLNTIIHLNAIENISETGRKKKKKEKCLRNRKVVLHEVNEEQSESSEAVIKRSDASSSSSDVKNSLQAMENQLNFLDVDVKKSTTTKLIFRKWPHT